MWILGAEIFLVSVCVASTALNFDNLSKSCLQGQVFDGARKLECVTAKGVNVVRIREYPQTFYCISYEKKTGNINDFDILAFDLHKDYDLSFIGANVLNGNETHPRFKLYDSRTVASYKGRFAITSETPDFALRNIWINDEKQICNLETLTTQNIGDALDESGIESTTYLYETTTIQSSTPSYTPRLTDSCGMMKQTQAPGSYQRLPSYPGQFPWTVSIYRYFDGDGESYYKCAGTIVDRLTILTSVNCLLEDGLLLKPNELMVYVSPYALSAKPMKSKMHNVLKVSPHERYNYHLHNNIAALKLSREIEYDDYTQPICLPPEKYECKGKIGKLAAFGKPSSRDITPKSDLLTEAEYHVNNAQDNTFNAENTSGNSRICDMGSGLYANETNHWTLIGIISRKSPETPIDSSNQLFTFTYIVSYLPWIRDTLKPIK